MKTSSNCTVTYLLFGVLMITSVTLSITGCGAGATAVGTGGAIAAGGAIANLTLSAVLGNLTSKLHDIMESARNAGRHVVIEAGRETNLAIANAQNAYSESLNKTMDQLDKKTRSTVDQLETLVKSLESEAFNELDSLTEKSQQIINSLPFRKHQPQLTSATPRFVVPSAVDYPVHLKFKGNFEFAAKKSFLPQLKINGKSYDPVQNTTQGLEFLVPFRVLFGENLNGKYSLSRCEVVVPWEEPKYFGGIIDYSHVRREDVYHLLVGALPEIAGHVQIHHTVKETKKRTRRFSGPEIYQSSKGDGGNEDHKDVPHTATPTSGWHVIRNTSSLDVIARECDDLSTSFISDDGDHVVYNVTTIYHRFGCASAIRFRIAFDEYQEYEEERDEVQEFDLKWGERRVFPYQSGSWKVVFVPFDRSPTVEFSGTTTNHKFTQVTTEGGSLNVTTVDPQSLIWP